MAQPVELPPEKQGEISKFYALSTPSGVQDLENANFNSVPIGSVSLLAANVPVQANNPIVGFSFIDAKGNDLSSVFQAEKNFDSDKPGDPCSDSNTVAAGQCMILIGFSPADQSAITATLSVQFLTGPASTVTLKANGAAATTCVLPRHKFLPLRQDFTPGKIYPLLPASIPPGLAEKIYNDLHDPIRRTLVNCFYNTTTPFTVFNQYRSIYNAASGSDTVKLQIGSMNFGNGMQVTLATNPQISTNGSSSTAASSGTLTGGLPTLSSTSSAQAAQNILNGGTFYGEDLYPLFSRQGTWMATLDGTLREGIDIQKFNNTSTTLTNPSSHTFVGLNSYFQYNSVSSAANSTDPAGSIFVSAMYGYNLMNHTYSVQNGFGGRINTQLAQVTAGVLLKGTVNIAASYGFGPSQRYIDSTTMATTSINNFNKWSVALSYQTSSSSKTK
jgi:hypothetical protein